MQQHDFLVTFSSSSWLAKFSMLERKLDELVSNWSCSSGGWSDRDWRWSQQDGKWEEQDEVEREWRHKWKQWERNTSSEEEQWPERRPEEEHEQKGPTTEKEFGPSQKQVGKERPERRSTAAASSDEVARRPAFHPEHRPGQPDWDPFFQEGRGKKSREDRKQRRANNPDVQARKEQGLKEGFPEHPQEKQTVGSYKWRLMKEREKEMLEDERKIMLERKQLQEERAAFLAEREDFLEQREKREASIPRNVRLVSVRPEKRPNPYKREREGPGGGGEGRKRQKKNLKAKGLKEGQIQERVQKKMMNHRKMRKKKRKK